MICLNKIQISILILRRGALSNHHHHLYHHDNEPTFNPFLSPDGLPCPSVQLNELKVQTAVRFLSRNSKPYDFMSHCMDISNQYVEFDMVSLRDTKKVCFRNNLNHSKAQNLSCESITTGCHQAIKAHFVSDVQRAYSK